MVQFSGRMVSEVVPVFWAAMARGEFVTAAAAEAGTYRHMGTRWLAAPGVCASCSPEPTTPIRCRPVCGRSWEPGAGVRGRFDEAELEVIAAGHGLLQA
jgi:hypothetical protein